MEREGSLESQHTVLDARGGLACAAELIPDIFVELNRLAMTKRKIAARLVEAYLGAQHSKSRPSRILESFRLEVELAFGFLLVRGYVAHEYKKGPLFITENGGDFIRSLSAEALQRIANQIEGPAKGRRKSGLGPIWQPDTLQSLSVRIETAKAGLPRVHPLKEKAEILAARIAAGLSEMPLEQMYVLWTNAQKYMSGSKELLRLAAPMLLNAIDEERQRRGSEATSPLPNGGFFRWPSTRAEHGDGLLQFEADAFGVLAQAGYRVGVARGEPEWARRRILAHLFEDDIPYAPGGEWGSKRSAYRLKKLADTIAALTRNAKRRGPQMARAVADWEADLEHLHDRFYAGRFDFPWPGTVVR